MAEGSSSWVDLYLGQGYKAPGLMDQGVRGRRITVAFGDRIATAPSLVFGELWQMWRDRDTMHMTLNLDWGGMVGLSLPRYSPNGAVLWKES